MTIFQQIGKHLLLGPVIVSESLKASVPGALPPLQELEMLRMYGVSTPCFKEGVALRVVGSDGVI